MNVKSMSYTGQSLGSTEDWIIDHMDFAVRITEEEYANDEAGCIAKLREKAIREVAAAMVDKGYGVVKGEYNAASRSYDLHTRIKLMRPKE